MIIMIQYDKSNNDLKQQENHDRSDVNTRKDDTDLSHQDKDAADKRTADDKHNGKGCLRHFCHDFLVALSRYLICHIDCYDVVHQKFLDRYYCLVNDHHDLVTD